MYKANQTAVKVVKAADAADEERKIEGKILETADEAKLDDAAKVKPKVVNETIATKVIETSNASGFKYKHNPSDNPKVLKDVVKDPNTVYGYRPRKDRRLRRFADGEWENPIWVEKYKQERIDYHNRNEGAAQGIVKKKTSEGASPEQIAREICNYRNQSRINSYIDKNGRITNMEGYINALERAKKNSYENLIKSGKTPEQIIKSATKGNSGMDACFGLYDDYFDTY